LARGRIHPMRVLENRKDWAFACQSRKLRHQRRQRPLLAALRGETWEGTTLGGKRQQGCYQGSRLLADRGVNQSLELREPFPRAVLTPEASGAFEMGDHRIERAVLVVGGAVEAQNLGISQLGSQCADQPRLPNTGLARDQY